LGKEFAEWGWKFDPQEQRRLGGRIFSDLAETLFKQDTSPP
jgi:hypothetical protein